MINISVGDSYLKYALKSGTNYKDRVSNLILNKVNNEFKTSLSYMQIKDSVGNYIDSQIFSDYTDKTNNKKTIILSPNLILNTGETFTVFNNKKNIDEKWLCTSSELFGNGLYYKGTIEKCEHTLKWVDKTQISREFPCIKSSTSLLSEKTKYMTLPSNESYILIQDNEFTRTIEADFRFIVGRKVYKVDSWDDNIGLIQFKMIEVPKDEKDIDVAWNPWIGKNTYNPIETEGYSVEFVNPSNYIYKNKTMDFSCIFKNNNTTISKQSNFYVTADDNLSPTLLATIISQNNTNNTCTIKANDKTGYIKLHVESSDKTITCDPIRIQIKSIV